MGLLRGTIKIKWSRDLAYIVGLLVTDGCLSKDGRHIDFTSKDREQAVNVMRCLELTVKLGSKSSGSSEKRYYRVQFGNVLFYRFLLDIGLTPAKTHTIGAIEVPDKYFFDFLRGHFDGDGSFYSYWDPRWRSSFMFYTAFVSASRKHLVWLQRMVRRLGGPYGYINPAGSVYQLRFAKADSFQLLQKMYPNVRVVCLTRKRLKIEKALGIVGLSLK